MRAKRAHEHRVSVLSVLLVIVTVIALQPAISLWAFKPKNSSSGKNPSDSTHQSITEDAIKELDLEFFGITQLSTSMKKAVDKIVAENAGVDLFSFFFR